MLVEHVKHAGWVGGGHVLTLWTQNSYLKRENVALSVGILLSSTFEGVAKKDHTLYF